MSLARSQEDSARPSHIAGLIPGTECRSQSSLAIRLQRSVRHVLQPERREWQALQTKADPEFECIA